MLMCRKVNLWLVMLLTLLAAPPEVFSLSFSLSVKIGWIYLRTIVTFHRTQQRHDEDRLRVPSPVYFFSTGCHARTDMQASLCVRQLWNECHRRHSFLLKY